MATNVAGTGAALLIAAAPAGKGRLVDAGAVLPALSAVPAQVLTGAPVASVVQLVDPADPQAVLAQLQTAARAPGPLLVYLVGQLHLDRRQHEPHVALARTTPLTVRYTALPWRWISDALRERAPGTSTVFADLVADEAVWQHLSAQPLALGPGIELYGTVAPPPARRRTAVPVYTKAVAGLLRGCTTRPPLDRLHQQAAAQADVAGQGALLFAGHPAHAPAPPAAERVAVPVAVAPVGPPRGPQRSETIAGAAVPPGGQPPPRVPAPSSDPDQARPTTPAADPHPAILRAAGAGRHTEAAAAAAEWEQHALRTFGYGSQEAIHWLEVRADLARLAGDPARSCELWMTAATARLTAQEAADSANVEGAVDRAHHQWEQLRDTPRERELAPSLVALRRQVPGRQRGALEALEQRAHAVRERPPAG